MFAIKKSEQRQRLATNFHRTKTEPHRTCVDFASPGDGWKSEPAQNLYRDGRGGLPDGGGDRRGKRDRSRAVSGSRRVTLGVPPPPFNSPLKATAGVDAPVETGFGQIFLQQFRSPIRLTPEIQEVGG